MTDKKISALTAATIPLAGTEVFPIVQGGVTVKISAVNFTAGSVTTNANLTGPITSVGNATSVASQTGTGSTFVMSAGPTISGNQTLSTGNLIPATAGKGIDFSANSSAAGMTSELFNWYEEGTWTPIDTSGAGLILVGQSGHYTRNGRAVTVSGQFVMPATANILNMSIGGLPFTVGANSTASLLSTYATAGEMALLPTGTTSIFFYGVGVVRRTNANYTSVSIYLSATYRV